MKEKLVLVVDDSKNLHRSLELMHCRSSFPVRFIGALRLKEAEDKFKLHRDSLEAILVDGCVETKRECDTIPFIQLVTSSGFRRPVVAMSVDRRLRRQMVAAGCTRACEKHEIRHTLEELLFPPEPKKRPKLRR